MLSLILMTKGARTNPRDLLLEIPEARKTSISLRYHKRGRELDVDKLLPSSSTLIIVPAPLLEHWRYQVKMYLERRELKVFLDEADFKIRDLPSPERLIAQDIVITTFERLGHQWKFHKPKSASERNRPNRYGFEDAPDRFIDGLINRGTSPLLKVHWLRIVVDEGHKLGGRRSQDHILMAELLHANKRWVMMGTPTPHTLWSADLRHMHGLLVFLRHRPYGEADAKAWTKAISRPFELGDRAGYLRLLDLLRRIMMRHTKDSILKEIPTPIRRNVFVSPTLREYAVYNGVAAAVRANLVANSNNHVQPGVVNRDSLLHRDSVQFARNAIQNLRSATYGGGSISVTLTGASLHETIKMLAVRSVSPELVSDVSNFMNRAVGTDVLSQCTVCGRHLPVLMLVPCGHMSCADCLEARVASVGQSCEVCSSSYDWEDLQKIQPGFEVKIVDDNWDYDHGEAEKSDSQPAKAKKKRKHVAIDHTQRSSTSRAKGEQHGYYWDQVTHRPKVLKTIVYSRSREHIYRVKVSLAQHGVPGADFMAPTAAQRLDALVRFCNSPRSNVLLMTDSGSHGLDLSFVTHIFLMEQIFDKSLEKQIVARAHRMGAQHSVIVEKILMRGTLEETADVSDDRAQLRSTPEDDGSLIRTLLRRLRLIQESDVAQFGFLKYEMRTEAGATLSEANVVLTNPGKKPSIATPDQPSASETPGASSDSFGAPAASTASTAVEPQPSDAGTVEQSRPAVRFALPESNPPALSTNPPPARHEEPEPKVVAPRIEKNAKRKAVSKEKTKIKTEKVKIKTEEAKIKAERREPEVKQTRKRPPPPPVIDLTADSDSDLDDAGASHGRAAAQTSYSASFYRASSEEDSSEDDSETDDEWLSIKTERSSTKRSPARTPAARAKEPKRICIAILDDEDTDED